MARRRRGGPDEPGYHGECWICGGARGDFHYHNLPQPIPVIAVHLGPCQDRLMLALTGALYGVAGCYSKKGVAPDWLASQWEEANDAPGS